MAYCLAHQLSAITNAKKVFPALCDHEKSVKKSLSFTRFEKNCHYRHSGAFSQDNLKFNAETSSLGRLLSLKAQSSDSISTREEELEDLYNVEECELVIGKELEIGHGLETISAHLSEAVKNRNGSGILLLTDVLGHKHPDTRDFAYRLACFGYSVLVPDLFRKRPWKNTLPDSLYEEWRARHAPENVLSDIGSSLRYLKSILVENESSPGNGRLAILGFCFGGGKLVEVLSGDIGHHFTTGVMFYGTRFDASLSSKIKVPLLLITGGSDPLSPVEVMRTVSENVPNSKLIVYPGCGHAFAHHPKTLDDDDAAEAAFFAMKQWLSDHLLDKNDKP